jgi:hypothetical protein
MPTPAESRDQLIRDLRATRAQLMSPEWLTMMQSASKAQQQKASRQLMNSQLALLKLESEALASFRDQLVANEPAIAQATIRLRAALDRLRSVAKVLTAVGDFLRLVGRVVKLL